MKSKKLSLAQSLGWILFSTLLISGSVFVLLYYYKKQRVEGSIDSSERITAIVQTGPKKEALKTVYLAELMGISVDRPEPLFRFDVKRAEEKLLSSPVIKKASVKLLSSGTLYVDYTTREPQAWLYEYENTAIDEEGYLCPVYPFFSPKNLPEIYLGLPPFGQYPVLGWNIPLKGKEIELAFSLLKLIKETEAEELIKIKRIDVSNAFSESYGMREIVLICEDRIGNVPHTRLLRLSPKNYPQELGNYLKLREQLIEKERNSGPTEKVIDLRLSKLAFIEERAK
jgi:hypothetical protein